MSGVKSFPYLVDSHAHLDFKDFNKDREEVLVRAEKAGVKVIINAAYDLESSYKAVQLAEQHSFIYASAGIHPHDAGKATPDFSHRLEELSIHPKVVALGEMGLDYYRDRSPRQVQQEVFRKQLRVAIKVNLPVIIHDRDAHEDVLYILEEEGLPAAGGVMHCFSGDYDLAQRVMEMGLDISVAGPVTYSKSAKLARVVSSVPLDRLLLETDAPFLSPVPLRGKRNEPSYVAYVADRVAALRGITGEKVGRSCLENARRLFGLEL